MGLKAFAVAQHRGNLAQHLSALLAHFDQAAALLEIHDAQGRTEARGAAGGQHVVGARAIVAQ